MSACVCIRSVALERNCKCLCVCLRVCCACLSPCTNGEIGGKSHPEGKGHSSCKREKGNSNFLNTLLPNAPALPSLCFPSPTLTHEDLACFQRVTPQLLHSYLSARLSTTNHAGASSPFNMPQSWVTTSTFSWEGWNLTTFWTKSDLNPHLLFSVTKLSWNAWVMLKVMLITCRQIIIKKYIHPQGF